MKNQVLETARVFKSRLLATPLLLGWLLLGPFVALYLEGWTGLAFSLINLILIGIYAFIIRWMTPDPPAATHVKRPTLELALALGLFILFLLVQMLDFGAWDIQPWQAYVSNFFLSIGRWTYSLVFITEWARQDVYLALSSTIKKLAPTLLVFVLLGYGRRAMGMARPHWRLTALLVGLTAAFGLLTGVLTRAPLGQVLALYAIGIFVNALPEELFFRGLLLPRLEAVLANPLNALVVAALFFNAIHLPLALAQGEAPLEALLNVFSTAYPTGLIWGYLYLRTRSILPGVFWHAANGTLGFIMMNY